MGDPTNVVALVESDFLEQTRKLMKSRDTAQELHMWVAESLRGGKHVEEIVSLVGDLINENFSLEVQLKGRVDAR
ncbi:TPA: hypothetical protein ACJI3N_005250 [Raoultella planticola]